MRTKSCRKCGTEMNPNNHKECKCIVCGKPNRMYCANCDLYGEEEFHEHVLDVCSRTQLVEMTKNPEKKTLYPLPRRCSAKMQ